MTASFESAYQSQTDAAQMECGVCWRPYDPNVGDPSQDVAPGTPFAILPAHWRCPSCDTDKSKFLLVAAGAAAAADDAPEDRVAARVAALESAFASRDAAMKDLPIYNGLLRVEAIGFRPFGGQIAGVLITPWFMNLVVMPETPDDGPVAEGAIQSLAFPCGSFDFISAKLNRLGAYQMCSLFSPMHQFVDQAVARETAKSAAQALFTPPEPRAKQPDLPSRRILVLGA